MVKKRILGKSAINNTHRFAGRKNESTIFAQTSLEYHTCFHFEYSPQVVWFESQPIGFEYEFEGKIHTYTPDFLVIDILGNKRYFEAKLNKFLEKDSISNEIAAKQRAAEMLGATLEAIDEEQVYNYPLLDNLKIVNRYQHSDISFDLASAILEYVGSHDGATVDCLNKALRSDTTLIPAVCFLIARGRLHTDLHVPLSQTSSLTAKPAAPLPISNFESLFGAIPQSKATEMSNAAQEQKPFIDLTAFSEEQRATAIHRLNVLNYLVGQGVSTFSTNNIQIHHAELKDKFGAQVGSIRSIQRWWEQYRKGSYELTSLVPKRKTGNRLRKVAPELEELIDSAIKLAFSAEQPNLSEAYRRLEVDVLRYNDRKGTRLKAPAYESFRQRVAKVAPYERLKLQKGKKAADSEFREIKQKLKTTRVMERVEVDHTRLDLFVVDDVSRLPLGRPYLTVFYDAHSSSVVGFYLGFEPPSFLSVSRALRNTILPKSYLSEKYPNIQNAWPCHGVPELLVVDNGKEFWDRDFTNACRELNIDIGSNPTKHPWLKASVERFFGTVNTRLLSSKPGKTFSNVLQRDDYDPAKHAVISKSAILEITHQWIVDDYQVSPNSACTNIPDLNWRESSLRFPASEFKKSLVELDFRLGRVDERKLIRRGITLNNIRYHSIELAALRAQRGDHTVKLKYDPGNLGYIFILNSSNSSYFKVYAVDQGYASGLTLWQHKINQRFAKRHIKENYNHQDVVKARAMIQEIIEREIQQSKKRKPPKSSSKISDRVRSGRYQEVDSLMPHSMHLPLTPNEEPQQLDGNSTMEAAPKMSRVIQLED